jgi:hypothetical protein
MLNLRKIVAQINAERALTLRKYALFSLSQNEEREMNRNKCHPDFAIMGHGGLAVRKWTDEEFAAARKRGQAAQIEQEKAEAFQQQKDVLKQFGLLDRAASAYHDPRD